MPDLTLSLPLSADTTAPSSARQFVEAQLAHVPNSVVFDITLAVSELVTNVIRHGGQPAELELVIAAASIRVAVTDSGDQFVRDGDGLPASDSTGGRGLFIVSALANEWGITSREGGGKTVWFEVAVDGA